MTKKSAGFCNYFPIFRDFVYIGDFIEVFEIVDFIEVFEIGDFIGAFNVPNIGLNY